MTTSVECTANGRLQRRGAAVSACGAWYEASVACRAAQLTALADVGHVFRRSNAVTALC